MAHLFVSYSRSNLVCVDRLVTALHEAGHTTWFDKRSIRPGENWELAIGRGLADADALLLVLSTAAVRSEWVSRELALAHERHKPIVPVMIEALPSTELPAIIRERRIQVLDLQHGGELFAMTLLAALPPAASGPRIPFIVDHLRLSRFVGREDLLRQLDAMLSTASASGWLFVGLTGMGGIGKTQLAVEYAYRYRYFYPDGVFMIDARRCWGSEFARLFNRIGQHRESLGPTAGEEELAEAMLRHLDAHRDALVIFDGVEDPADLGRAPIAFRRPPATLSCRVLFTTRRGFTENAMRALPIPALDLDEAREVITRWRPDCREDPDLDTVCNALGCLPLMLALAAAFLLKKGKARPIAYLNLIKAMGADAAHAAARLRLGDLEAYEELGITPALLAQWSLLETAEAMQVLRIMSLYEENAAVPIARLSLVSDLADSEDGIDTPLADAIAESSLVNLLERLEGSLLRLHPLVRDFVKRRQVREPTQLACEAGARLAAAYENFETLEHQCAARTVDAIQGDLESTLGVLQGNDDATGQRRRLQDVLRVLQREGYVLQPDTGLSNLLSSALAQQFLNRAKLFGLETLAASAERWLLQRTLPYLKIAWQVGEEASNLVRTLFGHTGTVMTVVVSLDGRLVISGATDRTIRVWSLDTGRILFSFNVPSPANALALVETDAFVAVCDDGAIRLWSLSARSLIREFVATSCALTCLAATQDGRFVLAGAKDGTTGLWDVATGAARWIAAGDPTQVSRVAMAPDGAHAVSAQGTMLKVWSLETGAILRAFDEHQSAVCAIDFTPAGHCVSTTRTGEFRVRDIHTREVIYAMQERAIAAEAIVLTRGCMLTANGVDLIVWKMDGSSLIAHPLRGHGRDVTAIAVSPDNRHLVSASSDCTVRIWRLDQEFFDTEVSTDDGHRGRITGFAFTPDGRTVVSGSLDRTVKTWDPDAGAVLQTFSAGDRVRAVVVASDGSRAISGCLEGGLQVWNLASGRLEKNLGSMPGGEGPRTIHVSNALKDLVTIADGRCFVATTLSAAWLWNMDTGTSTLIEKRFAAGVAAIPGAPCVLLSGGERCDLWDYSRLALVRTIADKALGAIGVTPDGRYVISNVKGAVTPYDLELGKEVDWSEMKDSFSSALVLSDSSFGVLAGGRLGVAASGTSLGVWDLVQGALVAEYMHPRSIHCMTLHGGTRVMIGDDAGVVACLELIVP